MTPPYSSYYGAFFVTDELVDEICAIPNESDLTRFVEEIVCDAASPYKLFNFANFDPSDWDDREDCVPDIWHIVIDCIIDNRAIWDPDEVACFLLEWMFEYRDNPKNADLLIALTDPDIIHYDNAGEYIWELFWAGAYPEVLQQLFSHYGWIEYVAQEVEDGMADGETTSDKLLHRVTAEMVRKQVLYDAPSSVTKDYVEGYDHCANKEYLLAIEPLIRFHEEYPTVFPFEISLVVAQCQFEVGWHAFALERLEDLLEKEPDNSKAEQLRQRILLPQQQLAAQIEAECAQPHWTQDSRATFVATEVIYRFQGKIGREYGAMLNGYGRAVEIQLRNAVQPELRRIIANYGIKEPNKSPYLELICPSKSEDKVTLNVKQAESGLTLGKWALVFKMRHYCDLDNPHCIRYHISRRSNESFGYFEWANKMSEFGQELESLAKLRNKGSHTATATWQDVMDARNSCIFLLNEAPAALGGLHKTP